MIVSYGGSLKHDDPIVEEMRLKGQWCKQSYGVFSRMEKGHEPSQDENLSARALARASSARTHHYYLPTTLSLFYEQKPPSQVKVL